MRRLGVTHPKYKGRSLLITFNDAKTSANFLVAGFENERPTIPLPAAS
jgi:hypothetical protein